MAIPSPVPVRFPAGVSTDFPYGPLANFGAPNPFQYHLWQDDFNWVNDFYTTTANSNGTVASAAGNGSVALFTTNSSTPLATDIVSIQLPAAGFVLAAGKKAFFLTRLKMSSISNAQMLVGMIQTTTTPYTVVDGIYFTKATGALNNLTLKHAVGSTITTLTIPTSAYTLANNTYVDLGWYLDRNGVIWAFVGSQLVGWLPQSSPVSGQARGPCAEFTPATLTTATLNPTLALKSGTAASSTMTVDFAMAAVER